VPLICADDSLMMAVRESKHAVNLIMADFGKWLYVVLPECSSLCVTNRMQRADEHNTAHCPLLLTSSAHNRNCRLVWLTNKTRRLRSLVCVWMGS